MTTEETRASFANKYTIHEEAKQFFRLSTATKTKSDAEFGVEGARQYMISTISAATVHVEFDGEQTEIIVPSPFTSEGIPISMYKPVSRPEVPAILIYFHGGGLIVGNRQTNESAVKILARDSGAIVLNVEYRLLPNPEAVYAPFDDAEVVTKWVLANREKVGGKANSKVGVGGDSAGGQIAIGVTNEILGLDFQILVYPLSDTSLSNDSFKEFKDVPPMNGDAIKFVMENGLSQIPDYLTNPRINGMARTNTASSPPALIVLAELDPLVGSGKEYEEKLRAAGVKVQLEIIKGVPHGFVTFDKLFPTTSAAALNHAVKFLRQFQ